jgi:hypothetical protein
MRRMRLLVLGAMALCLAIPSIAPAAPPPFDDATTSIASVPEGLGSADVDINTGTLSVETTVGDPDNLSLYTDGRQWARATSSVGRTLSYLPASPPAPGSKFNVGITIDVPQGEDAPWATANPDIPNATLSSDANVQLRAVITMFSCSIPVDSTEVVCANPAGDSDPNTQAPTQTISIACADVATTIEDPSGRVLMTCDGRGVPQITMNFTNLRPMPKPATSTWTTSYVIVDVELISNADTGLPAGYTASSGGTVTVSDISITAA